MSLNPAKPYEPPVSALLKIGEPVEKSSDEWQDYVAGNGFTSEHIPELLRMIKDETLFEPDKDETDGYAFIHAARVLGQLRDETALKALIKLAEEELDSDWLWEEIPRAIGLNGAPALPSLKDSLTRIASSYSTGATIIQSITAVSKQFPETRDEGVAIITEQLKKAPENARDVNGDLVYALTEWKATESLPVIEWAFEINAVDESMMGDWEDVQVEFGLIKANPNKKKRYFPNNLSPDDLWSARPDQHYFPPSLPELNPAQLKAERNALKNSAKKAKNKRKDASKARKKNRKK